MKRLTRIVVPVVTASLGVLALAGCSAAAVAAPETKTEAADSAVQPVSQANETAAGDATDVVDDACAATPDNRIDFSPAGHGPIYASLRHDLIDLGESSFAQGEVALDNEGQISSYTVAPGDSPIAIGERFCVDYITVLQLNNTWPTIDPGEVLELRPDPEEIWGESTPVEDAS